MKEYVEHLAGFALLLDWQARWRQMSDEVVVSADGLELGGWASQRFLLGAPRRPRYADGVFLGAQDTEYQWLSRIQWKRAALLLASSPRLCLVANRMVGDGQALPDIPAFSVSLPIADSDLAQSLSDFRVLEGRSIWTDEGRLEIASGPPMFRVPLVTVHSASEIMSDSERQMGRSMDDLINQRLSKTNREQQPGMAGAVP